MIYLSTGIYIITAILFCLFLHRKFSITRFVLLFFLITLSANVVIFETLHFLKSVNSIPFYLSLQILVCAIINYLSIKGTFSGDNNKKVIRIFGFRKLGGVDYFLLMTIGIVLASTYIVGITWPINNSDSLHTHLPRILYWLQQGSLSNWTNNPDSILAITYPINAHLQGLWLFLLGKSENLFFLVQWFSLLVACVSVYGITRNIGGSITHGLLASLLAASLPPVVLQVFSFQGDLLVAALLASGIFFLTEYTKNQRISSIYLCSIPLALSIGTKQTAFFVVPFLLVWLMVILIKGKMPIKGIAKVSLVFFLAFASLGIFKYMDNFIHFKSFTGTVSVINSDFSDSSGIASKFVTNTFRFLYQNFGSEGLVGKPMQVWESSRKMVFQSLDTHLSLGLTEDKYLPAGHTTNEAFSFFPSVVSEDTAWFGPLASIIWLIAFPISLFAKNKRVKRYALISFLIAFIYLTIIILQRPGWDPYQGRYFITPFLITVPIVSFLLPKNRIGKDCVGFLLAICSMFLFISTLILNVSRPLFTKATASNITNDVFPVLEQGNTFQNFEKDVIGKTIMIVEPNLLDRKDMFLSSYFEGLYYQNTLIINDAVMIDQIAATNDIYFWKTGRTPLEYSLFGKNVTRNVHVIESISDADEGAYIIIANEYADLLGDSVCSIKTGELFSIYEKSHAQCPDT